MKFTIRNPFVKIVLVFFLLLPGQFSCKEKEHGHSACGTDDPLENIQWLKELKTSLEMSAKMSGAQIILYHYNSEDVFLINDCYNCMDGLIQVYNCSGEVICQFGGFIGMNTCPDFFEEATDSTMLWDYVQH
jgi:hypothetical protein